MGLIVWLAAALWNRGTIKQPTIDDAIADASSQSQPTGWHEWPSDAPQPAIAPFDAERAKKHQEEWAAYLKVPVEYENSIGMKFVLIPPGEFLMGSTEDEVAAVFNSLHPSDKRAQENVKSELPQHTVILTQPLYLGVHEVTQSEYKTVIGHNPSHFAPLGGGQDAIAGLDTARHPVEMVQWNDAAEFCIKLSGAENFKPLYLREGDTFLPLDGNGYRLPSEAEWEFACRAGTTTSFWVGDKDVDLIGAGWFSMNSAGRTHAVSERKANPFGLYDSHGNVWEWVQDGWNSAYYGEFAEKPAVNPSSPFSNGSHRVLRGGFWNCYASICRASFRLADAPTYHHSDIGFRVALSVEAVKQSLATSGLHSAPFALDLSEAGSRAVSPPLPVDAKGFTVEAWVRCPDEEDLSNRQQVFQFGERPRVTLSLRHPPNPPGPRTFFEVLIEPGTGTLYTVQSFGELTPGGWHHAALVVDKEDVRLFVDGKPHPHGPVPYPLTTQEAVLTLGGGDPAFRGEIKEVRVSRGLRYADAFALRPITADKETLALYRCDEGAGDVLRDSSVHNHHGKTNLAKWVKQPALEAAGWHGWPADAPKPAVAPFDSEQAKQHQEAWAAYLKVPVEYTNSIGMKFHLIPPGEFLMGSTDEEIRQALNVLGSSEDWLEKTQSATPQHTVVLTQPYYLGMHEVTQGDYERVMGIKPVNSDENEAAAGINITRFPVDKVSWNNAAEFSTKLSQLESFLPFYAQEDQVVSPLSGNGYRLPTEAEWEFACRAGTTTRFWAGDRKEDVLQVDWCDHNGGKWMHQVGELKANPFGLHDMHGNLSEWVQDGWSPTHYEQFRNQSAVDPLGPPWPCPMRVHRGGYWGFHAEAGGASNRGHGYGTTRNVTFGCRMLLTVDGVKAVLAGRVDQPAVARGWRDWPADAPQPAIAPFDTEQANRHQKEWAAHLGVPVDYENSVGMKFRLIPPGEFLMGSTEEDIAVIAETFRREVPTDDRWPPRIRSEGPQHRVVLTRPFFLSVYETTQGQYERVMTVNPSAFAAAGYQKQIVVGLDTSNFPVETVSWTDAVQFCLRLSQVERHGPAFQMKGNLVERADGDGYRLPTEAEWEYACRAGTQTTYWYGDHPEALRAVAWTLQTSQQRPHDVGGLMSNPFGLHDVLGNVEEHCLDSWSLKSYEPYRDKPAVNPVMWMPLEPERVVRGGMWIVSTAEQFRCASRVQYPRESPSWLHGIRPALSVEAVKRALTPPPKTGWHNWPADAPLPAVSPLNAGQAARHQQEWAAYLRVPMQYRNSLGMTFRLIPPGEFQMGSGLNEPGRSDDEPLQRVCLTQPFYLQETELTVAQWRAFVEKSGYHTDVERGVVRGQGWDVTLGQPDGPAEKFSWKAPGWELSDEQPAVNLTFADLEAFLAQVSAAGSEKYRLPTDAEWEYACRAGGTTAYWFSDGMDEIVRHGNILDGVAEKTHRKYRQFPYLTVEDGYAFPSPARSFAPNPWGLYDITGNVWEACATRYHKPPLNSVDVLVDPAADVDDDDRVVRGGSWDSPAVFSRSAERGVWFRGQPGRGIGYRIALSVDSVRQALPESAIAPFDASQAQQHQQAWAAYLKVPVEYENSIGMKFRLIPPGEFEMGSTPAEIESALKLVAPQNIRFQEFIRSEGPQHRVVLTKPFYLGTTEVTQTEYQTIFGVQPSHFAAGGVGRNDVAGLQTGRHPVENVSWLNAVDLCNRLSRQGEFTEAYQVDDSTVELLAGNGYRLPTEAEWEFACRAGTATLFSSGVDEVELASAGWMSRNGAGRTHPVGELAANPFGLFDMHGNLWEWCHDRWRSDHYGLGNGQPLINPLAADDGRSEQVVRGGSWSAPAFMCRSTMRNSFASDARDFNTGFRLALSVEAVQQAAMNAASLLSFDGDGDYVEFAKFPHCGRDSVMLEAWVRPKSKSDAANVITWLGPNWITLFQSGDKWGVAQRLDDDSRVMVSDVTVVPDEWVHLAAAFEGDQLKLYVNGKPATLQRIEFPLEPTEQGLYLGGCPVEKLKHDGERWFHGDIRQVRISQGIRNSAAFIPEPKFTVDDATLACFDFRKRDDDVLHSSADKHNRPGKIVGAKWMPLDRAALPEN